MDTEAAKSLRHTAVLPLVKLHQQNTLKRPIFQNETTILSMIQSRIKGPTVFVSVKAISFVHHFYGMTFPEVTSSNSVITMFLTTDYLVVCHNSNKFQRRPVFLKLRYTTEQMHS
jgi:hypothetical protein